MDNNDKKIIDIDGNKLESFTDSAVEHLHDNDLKNKYSKILSESYDINRNAGKPTKRFTLLKKMAAIFILVIFSWVIVQSYSNNSVEELASNYVHSTAIFSNQNILRSSSNELLALRTEANKEFINKRYELAIDQYKKMESSSLELNAFDHFYLGISYLRIQPPNPQDAIVYLEMMEPLNALSAEANWMLSLAYIMNGNKDKAQQLLKTVAHSGSYKHQEAQILLDQLNE